MLLAPAWSIVAVTVGTMLSASATLGAHSIWNCDVGALVSTPSIWPVVSPASSIAARIEITLCARAESAGFLPYEVFPTPTMQ